MSIFAFHVFDITCTYDIAFPFVVIGNTHEERELQSTRLDNWFIAVYIFAAISSRKTYFSYSAYFIS